jgi:hypothetical protein
MEGLLSEKPSSLKALPNLLPIEIDNILSI